MNKSNFKDAKDVANYLISNFNSAPHRGARIPAPVEKCINQASIPDNMHPKYYNYHGKGNTITGKYITQEPFNKIDAIKFKKEFYRVVEYLKSIGAPDFNYNIHVECRDGADYGSYDIKIDGKPFINEDIEVDTMDSPKEGSEFAISELLNKSIKSELDAVSEYNTLALNARNEGLEDIARIAEEIGTEESKHIGQLQEALKTISPNAEAIEVGKEEGREQLGKVEPELTDFDKLKLSIDDDIPDMPIVDSDTVIGDFPPDDLEY